MKTAARIISFLFHPLLFATYLVLLLGWIMPRFLLLPSSAIMTFAALVFVMTFVLPVANLLMFRAFGSLTSLQMETRGERIVPFSLITIIYAVVSVMFFYKVSGNVNFNKLMVIIACLVFVATVTTFFIKVSVHTLAACGMVGILLPLNRATSDGTLLIPTVIILALSGVIMSARLYLNAHTPREVLVGAVTGFATGFFGMIVLF
jgi:membrane-associated phospholipid phosphatase